MISKNIVLSILSVLLFLLIGLEIFLPVFKTEMQIKPILALNLISIFGSLIFLKSLENTYNIERFSTGGQLIIALYILSFFLITVFFIAYFIFDIIRPALYDLFILEIALGIAIFNALDLDL